MQEFPYRITVDAAFETLNAIDHNDGDAIAVALEKLWITPDVCFAQIQFFVQALKGIFQMRPRLVAEVAPRLRIQRHHVHWLSRSQLSMPARRIVAPRF